MLRVANRCELATRFLATVEAADRFGVHSSSALTQHDGLQFRRAIACARCRGCGALELRQLQCDFGLNQIDAQIDARIAAGGELTQPSEGGVRRLGATAGEQRADQIETNIETLRLRAEQSFERGDGRIPIVVRGQGARPQSLRFMFRKRVPVTVDERPGPACRFRGTSDLAERVLGARDAVPRQRLAWQTAFRRLGGPAEAVASADAVGSRQPLGPVAQPSPCLRVDRLRFVVDLHFVARSGGAPPAGDLPARRDDEQQHRRGDDCLATAPQKLPDAVRPVAPPRAHRRPREHVPQVLGERGHVRVSRFRLRAERLVEHCVDVAANRAALFRVVARQRARQQFVQDEAERVDVRGRRGAVAAHLLRTGVGRSQRAPQRAGLVLIRGIRQLGDAEVEQSGLAARGDEDVRRLEIAMHDAPCVGIRDGIEHREEQLDPLPHRQPSRIAVLENRLALDVLYGQPVLAP
jgi:hypothetical protein